METPDNVIDTEPKLLKEYIAYPDDNPVFYDDPDFSKQDHSFNQGNLLEKGANLFLLITALFLLLGLGLPLLFIYLSQSPVIEQHFFFMGISYQKLIYMLFVSATIFVYASLFFLNPRPLYIAVAFVLLLFSCFPFIAGLRNNLTLRAALIDYPPFSNWPFFAKPAYVLIEFILPFFCFLYLMLQVKKWISSKSTAYSYAHLCVAGYLGIAVFLGLSILTQADQPNLMTLPAQLDFKHKLNAAIDFAVPDGPEIPFEPPLQEEKIVKELDENSGKTIDLSLDQLLKPKEEELLQPAEEVLPPMTLPPPQKESKAIEGEKLEYLSKKNDEISELLKKNHLLNDIKDKDNTKVNDSMVQEPFAQSPKKLLWSDKEDMQALFFRLYTVLNTMEAHLKESSMVAVRADSTNSQAEKGGAEGKGSSNITRRSAETLRSKISQLNRKISTLTKKVNQIQETLSNSEQE